MAGCAPPRASHWPAPRSPKFLPVVVSPAFWRRDLRLPLVFLLTVAGAYACYLSVGWKVLGFLGGYSQEEGVSGGSGIYWLRFARPSRDAASCGRGRRGSPAPRSCSPPSVWL